MNTLYTDEIVTRFCDSTFSPDFSPVGEMIAQRFGFTRNFLKGEAYIAERPNQGRFGPDLRAE